MSLMLDNPEHAEQVIVLLIGSATAAEMPEIINACVRAGLMWRCPACKQSNYPTREACDECRTSRIKEDGQGIPGLSGQVYARARGGDL